MKVLRSTPTQLSFIEPARLQVQLLRVLIPVAFVATLIAIPLFWVVSSLISSKQILDLTCRRVESRLVSCQLTVQDEQGSILEKRQIQPLQRAEVITAQRREQQGISYTCYVVLFNRPNYDPKHRFQIQLKQFTYQASDNSCEEAKQTATQINTFVKNSQNPVLVFREDNRLDAQPLLLTTAYWWGGLTLGLFLLFFIPQCFAVTAELWIFDKNLKTLFVKRQRLLNTQTADYPLKEVAGIQLKVREYQGTDRDGKLYYKFESELNLVLSSGETLPMYPVILTFYQGYQTSIRRRIDKVKKRQERIVKFLRSFLDLPAVLE